MKRILGFALFMIAAGMILMMFLPNLFAEICILVLCIVLGYCLFCC
ncbi:MULTISPECIES: hypothetical protein [Sellimonas]|nr:MULTISPECIES: hypothetical protein [Sellimonas]